MLQLTPRHRYFTPHWVMTLLTLLAIALFLRLGFWQLDRAHEKKQMIAALNGFSQQTPTVWSPSDPWPAQYQPVKLQGHFLPNVLLFDNQHHQHQFGYDVISALILESVNSSSEDLRQDSNCQQTLSNDQIVLVDRGWIPGDASRRVFPVADTPRGLIQLVGGVYYPSKKTWLLGPALEKKDDNLVVIELLDTTLISQFLHKSVYPFIIRLNPEAPNGYLREWPVVAMSPDRHYGYALQWFAMALVILIIYVALNFNKTNAKKKT